MNIISVLYYPFENNVVIKVTRGDDFFTYPQKQTIYTAEYNSEKATRLFNWYQKLQRLVEQKIFNTMKARND